MINQIADQVVSAGYEQKYSDEAVRLRITQEFPKLEKLVFSQFESEKPIPDIVKDGIALLDETLAWAIVLQGKTDIERLHMLGWPGPEIAKQVEDSGLEQSYTPDAVNKRLQIEFAKLQKLLVSQFESEDAVVRAGYEKSFHQTSVGVDISTDTVA